MNQKHLMLDIETWGQSSNSVIIQLSAVLFDIQTGHLGSTFNMFIDPNSSVRHGLKIEPSTVIWWMIQSDAARNNMVTSINHSIGSNSLPTVLSDFTRWFKENCNSDTIVWGRGPRFDFGLLTNAYNTIGLPIPWNFRNEMCVRTMEWLRPTIKNSIPKVDEIGHGSEGGGMHNGLTDAIYQTKYVSEIFKDLNYNKTFPVSKKLKAENAYTMEGENYHLKDIPGNNF
jgi:hypothetical protein